ncbi:hypothetical protein, conserved [Eimeria tenella]|uniref:Transmembrane protein n=1 Tax=Eimeria tenella TaxID=5802 RepID=U6L490_EIMTE|nr:hypothetical protein, conserved [Eimeria tenella]CDJ42590.1 hypothetical protein, conserved [Eimeria tenella]|eukprot:XP_013233340.1 hypothetical protein, conserved [Eimeria tenella]
MTFSGLRQQLLLHLLLPPLLCFVLFLLAGLILPPILSFLLPRLLRRVQIKSTRSDSSNESSSSINDSNTSSNSSSRKVNTEDEQLLPVANRPRKLSEEGAPQISTTTDSVAADFRFVSPIQSSSSRSSSSTRRLYLTCESVRHGGFLKLEDAVVVLEEEVTQHCAACENCSSSSSPRWKCDECVTHKSSETRISVSFLHLSISRMVAGKAFSPSTSQSTSRNSSRTDGVVESGEPCRAAATDTAPDNDSRNTSHGSRKRSGESSGKARSSRILDELLKPVFFLSGCLLLIRRALQQSSSRIKEPLTSRLLLKADRISVTIRLNRSNSGSSSSSSSNGSSTGVAASSTDTLEQQHTELPASSEAAAAAAASAPAPKAATEKAADDARTSPSLLQFVLQLCMLHALARTCAFSAGCIEVLALLMLPEPLPQQELQEREQQQQQQKQQLLNKQFQDDCGSMGVLLTANELLLLPSAAFASLRVHAVTTGGLCCRLLLDASGCLSVMPTDLLTAAAAAARSSAAFAAAAKHTGDSTHSVEASTRTVVGERPQQQLQHRRPAALQAEEEGVTISSSSKDATAALSGSSSRQASRELSASDASSNSCCTSSSSCSCTASPARRWWWRGAVEADSKDMTVSGATYLSHLMSVYCMGRLNAFGLRAATDAALRVAGVHVSKLVTGEDKWLCPVKAVHRSRGRLVLPEQLPPAALLLPPLLHTEETVEVTLLLDSGLSSSSSSTCTARAVYLHSSGTVAVNILVNLLARVIDAYWRCRRSTRNKSSSSSTSSSRGDLLRKENTCDTQSVADAQGPQGSSNRNHGDTQQRTLPVLVSVPRLLLQVLERSSKSALLLHADGALLQLETVVRQTQRQVNLVNCDFQQELQEMQQLQQHLAEEQRRDHMPPLSSMGAATGNCKDKAALSYSCDGSSSKLVRFAVSTGLCRLSTAHVLNGGVPAAGPFAAVSDPTETAAAVAARRDAAATEAAKALHSILCSVPSQGISGDEMGSLPALSPRSAAAKAAKTAADKEPVAAKTNATNAAIAAVSFFIGAGELQRLEAAYGDGSSSSSSCGSRSCCCGSSGSVVLLPDENSLGDQWVPSAFTLAGWCGALILSCSSSSVEIKPLGEAARIGVYGQVQLIPLYRQHVRVVLPGGWLHWREEGLLFWVLVILYLRALYRHCKERFTLQQPCSPSFSADSKENNSNSQNGNPGNCSSRIKGNEAPRRSADEAEGFASVVASGEETASGAAAAREAAGNGRDIFSAAAAAADLPFLEGTCPFFAGFDWSPGIRSFAAAVQNLDLFEGLTPDCFHLVARHFAVYSPAATLQPHPEQQPHEAQQQQQRQVLLRLLIQTMHVHSSSLTGGAIVAAMPLHVQSMYVETSSSSSDNSSGSSSSSSSGSSVDSSSGTETEELRQCHAFTSFQSLHLQVHESLQNVQQQHQDQQQRGQTESVLRACEGTETAFISDLCVWVPHSGRSVKVSMQQASSFVLQQQLLQPLFALVEAVQQDLLLPSLIALKLDHRLHGGHEPVLQIGIGSISAFVSSEFLVKTEDLTVNIHPVSLHQTPAVLRKLVEQEATRLQQLQAEHQHSFANYGSTDNRQKQQQGQQKKEQQQQQQQEQEQQPQEQQKQSQKLQGEKQRSKRWELENTPYPYVDVLVTNPQVFCVGQDAKQQQTDEHQHRQEQQEQQKQGPQQQQQTRKRMQVEPPIFCGDKIRVSVHRKSLLLNELSQNQQQQHQSQVYGETQQWVCVFVDGVTAVYPETLRGDSLAAAVADAAHAVGPLVRQIIGAASTYQMQLQRHKTASLATGRLVRCSNDPQQVRSPAAAAEAAAARDACTAALAIPLYLCLSRVYAACLTRTVITERAAAPAGAAAVAASRHTHEEEAPSDQLLHIPEENLRVCTKSDDNDAKSTGSACSNRNDESSGGLSEGSSSSSSSGGFNTIEICLCRQARPSLHRALGDPSETPVSTDFYCESNSRSSSSSSSNSRESSKEPPSAPPTGRRTRELKRYKQNPRNARSSDFIDQQKRQDQQQQHEQRQQNEQEPLHQDEQPQEPEQQDEVVPLQRALCPFADPAVLAAAPAVRSAEVQQLLSRKLQQRHAVVDMSPWQAVGSCVAPLRPRHQHQQQRRHQHEQRVQQLDQQGRVQRKQLAALRHMWQQRRGSRDNISTSEFAYTPVAALRLESLSICLDDYRRAAAAATAAAIMLPPPPLGTYRTLQLRMQSIALRLFADKQQQQQQQPPLRQFQGAPLLQEEQLMRQYLTRLILANPGFSGYMGSSADAPEGQECIVLVSSEQLDLHFASFELAAAPERSISVSNSSNSKRTEGWGIEDVCSLLLQPQRVAIRFGQSAAAAVAAATAAVTWTQRVFDADAAMAFSAAVAAISAEHWACVHHRNSNSDDSSSSSNGHKSKNSSNGPRSPDASLSPTSSNEQKQQQQGQQRRKQQVQLELCLLQDLQVEFCRGGFMLVRLLLPALHFAAAFRYLAGVAAAAAKGATAPLRAKPSELGHCSNLDFAETAGAGAAAAAPAAAEESGGSSINPVLPYLLSLDCLLQLRHGLCCLVYGRAPTDTHAAGPAADAVAWQPLVQLAQVLARVSFFFKQQEQHQHRPEQKEQHMQQQQQVPEPLPQLKVDAQVFIRGIHQQRQQQQQQQQQRTVGDRWPSHLPRRQQPPPQQLSLNLTPEHTLLLMQLLFGRCQGTAQPATPTNANLEPQPLQQHGQQQNLEQQQKANWLVRVYRELREQGDIIVKLRAAVRDLHAKCDFARCSVAAAELHDMLLLRRHQEEEAVRSSQTKCRQRESTSAAAHAAGAATAAAADVGASAPTVAAVGSTPRQSAEQFTGPLDARLQRQEQQQQQKAGDSVRLLREGFASIRSKASSEWGGMADSSSSGSGSEFAAERSVARPAWQQQQQQQRRSLLQSDMWRSVSWRSRVGRQQQQQRKGHELPVQLQQQQGLWFEGLHTWSGEGLGSGLLQEEWRSSSSSFSGSDSIYCSSDTTKSAGEARISGSVAEEEGGASTAAAAARAATAAAAAGEAARICTAADICEDIKTHQVRQSVILVRHVLLSFECREAAYSSSSVVRRRSSAVDCGAAKQGQQLLQQQQFVRAASRLWGLTVPSYLPTPSADLLPLLRVPGIRIERQKLPQQPEPQRQQQSDPTHAACMLLHCPSLLLSPTSLAHIFKCMNLAEAARQLLQPYLQVLLPPKETRQQEQHQGERRMRRQQQQQQQMSCGMIELSLKCTYPQVSIHYIELQRGQQQQLLQEASSHTSRSRSGTLGSRASLPGDSRCGAAEDPYIEGECCSVSAAMAVNSFPLLQQHLSVVEAMWADNDRLAAAAAAADTAAVENSIGSQACSSSQPCAAAAAARLAAWTAAAEAAARRQHSHLANRSSSMGSNRSSSGTHSRYGDIGSGYHNFLALRGSCGCCCRGIPLGWAREVAAAAAAHSAILPSLLLLPLPEQDPALCAPIEMIQHAYNSRISSELRAALSGVQTTQFVLSTPLAVAQARLEIAAETIPATSPSGRRLKQQLQNQQQQHLLLVDVISRVGPVCGSVGDLHMAGLLWHLPLVASAAASASPTAAATRQRSNRGVPHHSSSKADVRYLLPEQLAYVCLTSSDSENATTPLGLSTAPPAAADIAAGLASPAYNSSSCSSSSSSSARTVSLVHDAATSQLPQQRQQPQQQQLQQQQALPRPQQAPHTKGVWGGEGSAGSRSSVAVMPQLLKPVVCLATVSCLLEMSVPQLGCNCRLLCGKCLFAANSESFVMLQQLLHRMLLACNISRTRPSSTTAAVAAAAAAAANAAAAAVAAATTARAPSSSRQHLQPTENMHEETPTLRAQEKAGEASAAAAVAAAASAANASTATGQAENTNLPAAAQSHGQQQQQQHAQAPQQRRVRPYVARKLLHAFLVEEAADEGLSQLPGGVAGTSMTRLQQLQQPAASALAAGDCEQQQKKKPATQQRRQISVGILVEEICCSLLSSSTNLPFCCICCSDAAGSLQLLLQDERHLQLEVDLADWRVLDLCPKAAATGAAAAAGGTGGEAHPQQKQQQRRLAPWSSKLQRKSTTAEAAAAAAALGVAAPHTPEAASTAGPSFLPRFNSACSEGLLSATAAAASRTAAAARLNSRTKAPNKVRDKLQQLLPAMRQRAAAAAAASAAQLHRLMSHGTPGAAGNRGAGILGHMESAASVGALERPTATAAAAPAAAAADGGSVASNWSLFQHPTGNTLLSSSSSSSSGGGSSSSDEEAAGRLRALQSSSDDEHALLHSSSSSSSSKLLNQAVEADVAAVAGDAAAEDEASLLFKLRQQFAADNVSHAAQEAPSGAARDPQPRESALEPAAAAEGAATPETAAELWGAKAGSIFESFPVSRLGKDAAAAKQHMLLGFQQEQQRRARQRQEQQQQQNQEAEQQQQHQRHLQLSQPAFTVSSFLGVVLPPGLKAVRVLSPLFELHTQQQKQQQEGVAATAAGSLGGGAGGQKERPSHRLSAHAVSVRCSHRFVVLDCGRFQVFDYLLLHIDPVRVSLTSAFVECLYSFFFPPAAPQAVDAVALLAPSLKWPSPATAAAAAGGSLCTQGPADVATATAADGTASAVLGGAQGAAAPTYGEQPHASWTAPKTSSSGALQTGAQKAQAAATDAGKRPPAKLQQQPQDPGLGVYFCYVRVSPFAAAVTYRGAIRLDNVLVELRAFEVQHKLKPFKALIDKYIWFLGKQATGRVISHKLLLLLKRRRQHAGDSFSDIKKRDLLFGTK